MTFATLAGYSCARVIVQVPHNGPWWADVDLVEAPSVSGSVELALGSLRLRGTILAQSSGTDLAQRRVRLLAGAGAWGSLLPPKAYHSDARIRARTVIQDAAREAGETVEMGSVGDTQIGIDYVRQAGAASRALEDVIGAASWWVDFDGVTRFGTRPTSELAEDACEVLEYSPGTRTVTLATDDLTRISIGSVLRSRLDEPQTIRELTITVEAESLRVSAWCGESFARGRIAGAFRKLVEHSTKGLFGKRRYRVVRLSVDRLELQPVRSDAGLPSITPISMVPGIAGSHATLVEGAEVYVEFVDGDPREPIVTGFAGKGSAGHAPDEQALSVESTLRLGGPTATDAVALAPDTNARLNALTSAVNALINATPSPSDGGLALQTAVKIAWPTTKPNVDVSAAKVVAL